MVKCKSIHKDLGRTRCGREESIGLEARIEEDMEDLLVIQVVGFLSNLSERLAADARRSLTPFPRLHPVAPTGDTAA